MDSKLTQLTKIGHDFLQSSTIQDYTSMLNYYTECEFTLILDSLALGYILLMLVLYFVKTSKTSSITGRETSKELLYAIFLFCRDVILDFFLWICLGYILFRKIDVVDSRQWEIKYQEALTRNIIHPLWKNGIKTEYIHDLIECFHLRNLSDIKTNVLDKTWKGVKAITTISVNTLMKRDVDYSLHKENALKVIKGSLDSLGDFMENHFAKMMETGWKLERDQFTSILLERFPGLSNVFEIGRFLNPTTAIERKKTQDLIEIAVNSFGNLYDKFFYFYFKNLKQNIELSFGTATAMVATKRGISGLNEFHKFIKRLLLMVNLVFKTNKKNQMLMAQNLLKQKSPQTKKSSQTKKPSQTKKSQN